MPNETSEPIPVPVDGPGALTGCTEAREESEGGCSYILACDYFEVASKCHPNDDGTWACNCAGPALEGEQTIPPTDVSQACEKSAMFCIQNVVGELTAFECSGTTNSLDSDRCAATSDCRRTTTFADGTVAITAVPLEVECFPDGDSSLDCSCRDNAGSRSVAMEGVKLDSGCEVMTELCGRPPSETVTCGARNLADGLACDAKCGHEIETDSPNVRARLLDKDASSHCEIPTSGDDWYCSCANDAPLIHLYPVVSSSEAADVACLGAVNTCLTQDPFEPVGAAECSEAVFYEEPSSCGAGSDCMQPGVSAEYTVGLRGFSLTTNCQLTDAGLWQCYCASISASEYFGIEAATSGEACTTAYQTCTASAHFVQMHDGTATFVFTLPLETAGVE